MSWPKDVRNTVRRLRTASQMVKDRFSQRDLAVDLMVLATVVREHVLLLGPPGTGKSELVDHFSRVLHVRHFKYLLTRFTEPSELFGPLDVPAFQQGRYHIRTAGMLPEAEIAFLDEVFKGSSAILNTLLTLIHERQFFNGDDRQVVPLISLYGAANILPEDPTLKAFADRFILRLQLGPVSDSHLREMLNRGWDLERRRFQSAGNDVLPTITRDRLEQLHQRVFEVDLTDVRPLYDQIIRELRAQGVEMSDRRLVKGLKLVAGAALLRESDHAEPRDLWPLSHTCL